jgi:ABC-type phosphate transport system permease subunit
LGAGANAVKNAYASSFKFAWLFTIPFVVLGLIGVFFLLPINRQMNGIVDRPTKHILAQLEREAAEGRAHKHDQRPIQ